MKEAAKLDLIDRKYVAICDRYGCIYLYVVYGNNAVFSKPIGFFKQKKKIKIQNHDKNKIKCTTSQN
jgi:hypothetical protein